MSELSLSPVEVFNLAAKVLAYAACLAAVGTLAFLDAFAGALRQAEVAALSRHLAWLLFIGAAVSIAGMYATVALLSGGGFAGGLDWELWVLLSETARGDAVWVRLLGLAVLLAGLAVARLRRVCAVIGGLAVAASFGFIGHVQDDPHSYSLHALLMLHLLAAAFWIGSLWPLLRLADAPDPQRVAGVMEHFGRRAVWVVAALLAAGVVLAALLLDSVAAVLATGYGRLLLVKLALVAVLLCFAALNKWRLVPAMLAGAPDAGLRLRRSTATEILLVGCVFVATGLLTSAFSPP